MKIKKRNKKKILILSYYTFPCSHAVLKNVFAKGIGKIAEVKWIFHSHITQQDRWVNSKLILIKKHREKRGFFSIGNFILEWRILLKAFQLIFTMNPDIIFIRDLPFSSVILSPFKSIFKFKLYFQYSAPQGDIFLSYYKKVFGLRRIWYYLKGKTFNLFINKALLSSDIIFPISEFHKQQLKPLLHKKKMIPITMGVEKEWINSWKKPINNIDRIKNQYKFIIYFGSVGYLRDPEFIIEVFAKVKQKYSAIKLLLIGSRPEKAEMEYIHNVCRKYKIFKDVILTGRIERDKVKDYLSYSAISISAVPPLKHYLISSPTKVYESLGCGVPVVANHEIFEQRKVIKESLGGLLVPYRTDQFSNAIVYLLNNNGVREVMADRGKKYIENNYTYEAITKKISPFFV